ncbi:MAG: biotin/lipoate A/B protein ligase family protein [Porphyromonadaceae bacterium]|nr:biotin/lipoate A/B protein ligase family protein [Porphyromonadaceae bacterium]
MTTNSKAYYYISKTDDPFFNIALEDYLYTQRRDLDQIYFLWNNRPSVFMGRYQAAEAETDMLYLSKHGIPTLRRISGGGTVYHDHGNLNFSSIKNELSGRGFDLRSFPLPILQAIKSEGVELEVSPRGDLRINGFKVAGSAEATRSGRMLYHLCILFDADLNELERVLRVDPNISVRSRVASVRSSVCNLKPHLPRIEGMESFRSLIIQTLKERHGELIQLDEENLDLEYILRIQEQRYASAAWIYNPIGRTLLKKKENK